MAIPVILKGDTTATIYLSLADGYDYSDCWLDVEFCGVVTTRELPQAGSIVELHFTADETARFPLGTSKVFFTLRNSSGDKKTLPWAKIKVTDAPEEVASPVISIDPATLGDIDMNAADSLGDVKRKLNQLLSVLRGGALCLVSALCLPVLADIGPTTTLNDIPGNTTISNLVASSGAAVAGGGGISDEDVASITNKMTVYVDAQDALKRDKTDYLAQGSYWVMTCHDDAVLIEGVRNLQGTKTSAKNKTVTVTRTSSKCTVTWPLDTGTLTFEVSLAFFANDEWVAPNKKSGDIPYGAYTLRARWIAQNTLATRKDLDLLNADAVSFKDLMSGESSVLNKEVLDSMTSAIATSSADATEALSLASSVSTVVIGEDCQLVSTNYNSATKMPSLFLRFKIQNESTGTNEWHVVWNEMTRWNHLYEEYLPSNFFTRSEVTAELDQKADRAWGYYDSTTGNYAPEGFTWVSSPSIAIAGGLAYQRVVTTEGAIWVLESNGMTTITGGETNGFFRISDDKGNAIFEITKGTEVLAGATAGALRTETVNGITHLYITYNVESTAHPTIEVCNDLKNPEWATETDESCKANVVWSGSSGAWVAEVWGKQAYNSLFVRASYKKGQRDIITNSAPVSFTEIVIGGQTYSVSVGNATVDGVTKKVLVLE